MLKELLFSEESLTVFNIFWNEISLDLVLKILLLQQFGNICLFVGSTTMSAKCQNDEKLFQFDFNKIGIKP